MDVMRIMLDITRQGSHYRLNTALFEVSEVAKRKSAEDKQFVDMLVTQDLEEETRRRRRGARPNRPCVTELLKALESEELYHFMYDISRVT